MPAPERPERACDPDVRGNARDDGPGRNVIDARRPDLDGLRGIAVLLVIAYHYGLPGAGFLGVDIFFVLSGYLITSILASEWRRSGTIDWHRFWRNRALRILPAFWLMLAVVALTVPFSQVLISISYLQNWSMAFDWWPVTWSLGPTWSLAMEWQFYLVWPVALVFALSRFNPRTIALAAVVLGLTSALWRSVNWDGDWVRTFAGPDTHADGLLIGAALALGVSVPRVLWPLLLFALVPQPFGWVAQGGMLLAIVGAAAVISHPSRALAVGPLVAIGRISYGLYLWHVPIGIWIVNSGLGSPILALAVTLVVATLSWRFVEAPLQALRRPARTRPAALEPVSADPLVVEGVSVSPA